MRTVAPALAASAIRQSLIPMTVGYLALMVSLGLGLIRLRRLQRAGDAHPGPVAPSARRGWPAMIRQVAITVVGGYLLLMGVVAAYYYGVARVAGTFLDSAVTGPALLVGLTMPVFAAASWLSERRRSHRAGRGAGALRDGDSADG